MEDVDRLFDVNGIISGSHGTGIDNGSMRSASMSDAGSTEGVKG